jgi:hypothetical protein
VARAIGVCLGPVAVDPIDECRFGQENTPPNPTDHGIEAVLLRMKDQVSDASGGRPRLLL